MRIIYIIFFFICFYNIKAQKSYFDILEDEYDTTLLKQDIRLLRKVFFDMHPVVDVYHQKSYFDSLFNNALNKINEPLTHREFYIQLKYLVDGFQCGHTEVGVSRAYSKVIKKTKRNYSPYFFVPINNKLYAIATLSKNNDTLIKKGDEIVAINGYKADSLIKWCKNFITVDGYNTTGKSYLLQYWFNSLYQSLTVRPDTYVVDVLSKTNKPYTVKYKSVNLLDIPELPIKPKQDSTLIKYKRAAIKYKIYKNDKYCYFKLGQFSNRKYKKGYRKIFRKINQNNITNLVLDLRDNGGGSLSNCYRLLSYLIDTTLPQTSATFVKSYSEPKYTKGKFAFKITKLYFKIVGKQHKNGDTNFYTVNVKPRKKYHFNGKLIVLINGSSFSASCLASAYLKHNKKVTFIGQETSGALEGCNAGVTPFYTLPNSKLKVRIPVFRINHDVFKTKTGHGIMPDYEITYTLKDLITKKDLELEKAKALILVN
ncbi:MAG: S41 family peptidase [Bacteroidetes bacterium]|nr:S41 family peptidase [Bacteroidota bacterium]